MRRRKWIAGFLTACLLATTLTVPALADEEFSPGFYGVGSAEGVTVTPLDASGNPVAFTNVDIEGENSQDAHYPGSVKLQVTVSNAQAGQYLVLLMEGNDDIPNKDNAIWFIDQTVPEDGEVNFMVYPDLSLLSENTNMTMFITSGAEGFQTKSVKLGGYAVREYVPYTLGDLTGEGQITAADASVVLQRAAWLITLEPNLELAADVTGDGQVTAADAAMVLQRAAWLIDHF